MSYKSLNQIVLVGDIVERPQKEMVFVKEEYRPVLMFTIKTDKSIVKVYDSYIEDYEELIKALSVGVKGELIEDKVFISEYYVINER